MATVLYPGSFDPIHLGHVDIIEQASRLFGKVVVAILHNPEKHGGVFSVDERIALIQVALQSAQVKNVEIHAFPGLAVDAARVVQGQDGGWYLIGFKNIIEPSFQIINHPLVSINGHFTLPEIKRSDII